MPAVGEVVNGNVEWAAIPASSARARGPSNTEPTNPFTDRSA
jgi:hypothetical protein